MLVVVTAATKLHYYRDEGTALGYFVTSVNKMATSAEWRDLKSDCTAGCKKEWGSGERGPEGRLPARHREGGEGGRERQGRADGDAGLVGEEGRSPRLRAEPHAEQEDGRAHEWQPSPW